MAVKAYILMNLAAAGVADTLKELREIKGLKFADAVTGPYDAVALVEVAEMDRLGEMVTGKILKVKGVAKTLTCVVV